MRDEGAYTAEYKRISAFMLSGDRTTYTGLHKSPWRKQNRADYGECISYFQKVFGLNSGKMLGVIELEIPSDVLVDLYRTVMSDTTSIEIAGNDIVIASPEADALYRNLSDEPWYTLYEELGSEIVSAEERDAWYFLGKYKRKSWTLICRISKTAYRETIRGYLISLIMIALLVIIVSSALIRFLIRSIRNSDTVPPRGWHFTKNTRTPLYSVTTYSLSTSR